MDPDLLGDFVSIGVSQRDAQELVNRLRTKCPHRTPHLYCSKCALKNTCNEFCKTHIKTSKQLKNTIKLRDNTFWQTRIRLLRTYALTLEPVNLDIISCKSHDSGSLNSSSEASTISVPSNLSKQISHSSDTLFRGVSTIYRPDAKAVHCSVSKICSHNVKYKECYTCAVQITCDTKACDFYIVPHTVYTYSHIQDANLSVLDCRQCGDVYVNLHPQHKALYKQLLQFRKDSKFYFFYQLALGIQDMQGTHHSEEVQDPHQDVPLPRPCLPPPTPVDTSSLPMYACSHMVRARNGSLCSGSRASTPSTPQSPVPPVSQMTTRKRLRETAAALLSGTYSSEPPPEPTKTRHATVTASKREKRVDQSPGSKTSSTRVLRSQKDPEFTKPLPPPPSPPPLVQTRRRTRSCGISSESTTSIPPVKRSRSMSASMAANLRSRPTSRASSLSGKSNSSVLHDQSSPTTSHNLSSADSDKSPSDNPPVVQNKEFPISATKAPTSRDSPTPSGTQYSSTTHSPDKSIPPQGYTTPANHGVATTSEKIQSTRTTPLPDKSIGDSDVLEPTPPDPSAPYVPLIIPEPPPRPQIPRCILTPTVPRKFKAVTSQDLVLTTGLRNLGNSCYQNSIIQCLLATPEFNYYLTSGNYLKDVRSDRKQDPQANRYGTFIDELAAICNVLSMKKYSRVSANSFNRLVTKRLKFPRATQQDVHELLSVLLAELHDDVNEEDGSEPHPLSREQLTLNIPQQADVVWNNYIAKHRSEILFTFSGLESEVKKCTSCDFETARFIPFNILMLPIPDQDTPCTLSDCIREYLKPELLHGYKCGFCSLISTTIKQTKLWYLPKIIIIALKRFTTTDMASVKIDKLISCPLSQLPIIDNSTNRVAKYSLYGVSNHVGQTMERGHYTAHIKVPNTTTWCKCNDDTISVLSPNSVVTPESYVLFYHSEHCNTQTEPVQPLVEVDVKDPDATSMSSYEDSITAVQSPITSPLKLDHTRLLGEQDFPSSQSSSDVPLSIVSKRLSRRNLVQFSQERERFSQEELIRHYQSSLPSSPVIDSQKTAVSTDSDVPLARIAARNQEKCSKKRARSRATTNTKRSTGDKSTISATRSRGRPRSTRTIPNTTDHTVSEPATTNPDALPITDPHPFISERRHSAFKAPRRAVQFKHAYGRAISKTIEPWWVDLGTWGTKCNNCGAKFFANEAKPDGNGFFTLCCAKGKVQPPQFPPLDDTMQALYYSEAENFVEARKKIRLYNNALSLASRCAPKSIAPETPGSYCYKIQGTVHHKFHPATVNVNKTADGNQLFFCDAETAKNIRLSGHINAQMDADMLYMLEQSLNDTNPYVKSFINMKQAIERERDTADQEHRRPQQIILAFPSPRDVPSRNFAAPTADEVAGLYVGNNPPHNCQLLCYTTAKKPYQMKVQCSLTFPFTYPLLWTHGGHGWHPNIQHQAQHSTAQRTRCTMRQFHCQLVMRVDRSFPVLSSQKLLHQFMVDSEVACFQNDLEYLKLNQKDLRGVKRDTLEEYVRTLQENPDIDIDVSGVKLSGSATAGTPRYMQNLYKNQMAAVLFFGPPDIFTTITTSTAWEPLKQFPFPQNAEHLLDMIVRMFNYVSEIFKDLVLNKQIFGRALHICWSIEFQKRGLPHLHSLTWLHDKIETPQQAELVQCAEIPSPELLGDNFDPEELALVKKHQMHQRCSEKCKVEGRCKARYPRRYNDETQFNGPKGRIEMRRRDTGVTLQVGKDKLDNQWIVDYNPYLLKYLRCHHNIEIVKDKNMIKYIFKYIYKEKDAVVIELITADETEGLRLEYDEIKATLEARYLSGIEAAWHLFRFPNHYSRWSVFLLEIHLPEQDRVRYRSTETSNLNENTASEQNENPQQNRSDSNLENAQKALRNRSTLIAFFKLCSDNPEIKDLKYTNVTLDYKWNRENCTWTKRKQRSKQIARMQDVTVAKQELFYVRSLLSHVCSPTSFESLRTVDGQLCDSFRDACVALGLLRSDTEFTNALRFSANYLMPKPMRTLFASMLLLCCLHNPLDLWNKYKQDLSKDLLGGKHHRTQEQAEQLALRKIAYIVRRNGGDLESLGLFSGLQLGHHDPAELEDLPQPEEPTLSAPQRLRSLNERQLVVYNHVESLLDGQPANPEQQTIPNVMVVLGPAGTGKTYLYNSIIDLVQSRGGSSVCMAWSGAAATLLRGGRTCHSTLMLPMDLDENQNILLEPNSYQYRRLRDASIIIWDEISMAPNTAFTLLEKFMREQVMKNNLYMGGKIIILGGDLRQVLPIAGKNQTQMGLSIAMHPDFNTFSRFKLTENQRTLKEETEFAQWLLSVGDGSAQKVIEGKRDMIDIPKECVVDPDKLISAVYGNDLINTPATRCILTPTNAVADRVNETILDKLPGEAIELYSADTTADTEGDVPLLSMDQLNNWTPPGYPPHKLRLKPNCVVMLLRNIDVATGLCNGTRLRVDEIRDKSLLVCTALAGHSRGQRVYITRVEVKGNMRDGAVQLVRLQFPVKLCYAQTINKSQGQTFDLVGVLLERPVFSHGQLYVALSRVRRKKDLKIAIIDGENQIHKKDQTATLNVVFRSIVDA